MMLVFYALRMLIKTFDLMHTNEFDYCIPNHYSPLWFRYDLCLSPPPGIRIPFSVQLSTEAISSSTSAEEGREEAPP